MKFLRKAAAFLLVALMLLGLGACGKEPSGNEQPDASASGNNDGILSRDEIGNQSSGEAPEGIVAGSSIVYHLNYTIGVPTGTGGASEADYFVQYNVYDGLVKATGHDLRNPRPAVAESWEVSEDGCVYTFHLREGITFSNGNSLDAEDVIYTFDLQKEYTPNNMAGIISYEAPNPYTVVVTMEKPQATFINQLGSFLWGIRDKETCETVGDPTAQETWVGCGPYYIESFTRDSDIVLKANPNYWDAENMPHIETVTCKMISDGNTAFVAMQTGDLDVLSNVTYLQAQQLAGGDECYVTTFFTPATYTIYFNTTREPFNDVRVRQALNHMIDKEEVNLAAFDGQSYEINICWYDDSPNYVPDEELPVTYEYDVDKGLALLAEAGYQPSDISFTILHSNNISYNTLVAENVQAQLLALGLNVELNGVNEATLQSTVIADDYDCVLYTGGSNLYNNIQIYWNMFTFKGRVNLPQYAEGDPVGERMNELITNAKYSIDMEASNALAKEATCLAVENALYLPMVVRPMYVVCSNRVQGMDEAMGSNGAERFLQYLWVVEE